MATNAIVDADPICYAIAFASQDYAVVDDEGNVCNVYESMRDAREAAMYEGDHILPSPHDLDTVTDRVDDFLFYLQEELNAGFIRSFLTPPDIEKNFRRKLNPEYKANRKDFVKPYHHSNIRKYLMDEWGSELATEGLEADDELAIIGWRAFKEDDDSVIICSIDKDLDTVPGWHYRWPTHNKEGSLYYQHQADARFAFWASALTGDGADNIIGIKGVGPKKSSKILEDCETEIDYYTACKDQYVKHFAEKLGSAESAVEYLHLNCRMLHLLRHEEDKWEVPDGVQ